MTPYEILAPWTTARRRRRTTMSLAWLEAARRALRPLHRRQLRRAGARASISTSSTRRAAAASPNAREGTAKDVDAAVAAARKAFKAWSALSGDARARHLYAIARTSAEARALLLGAGDDGQRQADPREPRHRHPAGRPPLLSPRRLGRADRQRVPRLRAGRRLRPDHPVEFSAADAGLEDRAGARGRQHGGAEAGRVHAADRARLRRDLQRGRAAAGRRQHRHRRRRDRRG